VLQHTHRIIYFPIPETHQNSARRHITIFFFTTRVCGVVGDCISPAQTSWKHYGCPAVHGIGLVGMGGLKKRPGRAIGVSAGRAIGHTD